MQEKARKMDEEAERKQRELGFQFREYSLPTFSSVVNSNYSSFSLSSISSYSLVSTSSSTVFRTQIGTEEFNKII
jgi:hypothetical protein